MKTIIAGSRKIHSYHIVVWAIRNAIRDGIEITEVVSGGAEGVDKLGEFYAKMHKLPVKKFPADWNKHGKRAGPIRNQQMADYADALIAVWDGKSRGTKDMIERAQAKGLHVFVGQLPNSET